MPCVKSGARAGSLYRNLVAHALTLGASGDRAPVRQQPWSCDFQFHGSSSVTGNYLHALWQKTDYLCHK